MTPAVRSVLLVGAAAYTAIAVTSLVVRAVYFARAIYIVARWVRWKPKQCEPCSTENGFPTFHTYSPREAMATTMQALSLWVLGAVFWPFPSRVRSMLEGE